MFSNNLFQVFLEYYQKNVMFFLENISKNLKLKEENDFLIFWVFSQIMLFQLYEKFFQRTKMSYF